jgi:hypothetical protein
MKTYRVIAFNGKEIDLLREYLNDCFNTGFFGVNNFKNIAEAREFFYYWHLKEVIAKVSKESKADTRYITLNLPEIKTIKAMFSRVDCCKEMIFLQDRFKCKV